MRRDPLLLLLLSAIAAGCAEREDTSMCLSVEPDAASCPAAEDVDVEELFHTSDCDLEAREITGEGELGGSPWAPDSSEQICCYPVVAVDPTPRSECMVGRPYLEGGAPQVAPLTASATWSGAPAASPHLGEALGEAWLRMASMEHASVAAFARLTLQLMAVGAPPELLAGVQQAAGDEVVHAQLCYAQAARFTGRAQSPGAFPLQGGVEVSGDLAQLAAEAAREGCLGETLGAWMAQRMAAAATDPRSREVLERIAEDEARHAALSWRIVAWAMKRGGAAAREAVRAALAEPFPVSAPLQVVGAERFGARDFGALDFGVIAFDEASLRQAMGALIEPAARALMAA